MNLTSVESLTLKPESGSKYESTAVKFESGFKSETKPS